MRIYFPIAKIDAESREVWGYASTEARDDQGEVVRKEALMAALGDYMKFANIREMHQLSAVGVAKEATVDDKGLYVGAKIVDDQAWQKVIEGVYKGYSIGGLVTQRDPTDHKIITGLVLNEISLVDRPANPEAVFDYWKAGGTPVRGEPRFDQPIQIWACGVSEHRHLAKSDAMRCQEILAVSNNDSMNRATVRTFDVGSDLKITKDASPSTAPYGNVAYADPGYQEDGKKRYPIDTEKHIRAAWIFINRPSNQRRYSPAQLAEIKSRIIMAWKDKIDQNGPPAAETAKSLGTGLIELPSITALSDVGHIARIMLDLDWLRDCLVTGAAMEGDSSPQASKLVVIIAELSALLSALVAEETGEILDDVGVIGEQGEAKAAEMVIMAAGKSGAALIADLCRTQSPKLQKLAAAILVKAGHCDGDQALLDLAHYALGKCMAMSDSLFTEKSHIAKALEALRAAGAGNGEATVNSPREPEFRCDPSALPPTTVDLADSYISDIAKRFPCDPNSAMLEMIATLERRGSGHQGLLDIAHDCIDKLTDGVCCVSSKVGARHSQETLNHLASAHEHLVIAGAKCGARDTMRQRACDDTPFSRTDSSGSLAKILAEERSDKAALVARLRDILPRLDQLTKRVEEIARAPVPPLAVSRNLTAISKEQDAGGNTISQDQLAAAFSQMSKEEQTLALIKSSHAHPIHPSHTTFNKEFRRW